MYIDTHTKETIEKSICSYFNVNIEEIYILFDEISLKARKDLYIDGDMIDTMLNSFIESHPTDTAIDEVLFFHLSRRLNNAMDCLDGNNLFDLLSTKNAMTDFLKAHNVEFKVCDKHLQLLHKGKVVSLEDTYQQHVPYLRSRLGYNADRIDYCFNGFLLKDLLYCNNYARSLYSVPEFIASLANFLGQRSIITDYYANSKYYCFEYRVPLEIIAFDDNEKFSGEQKRIYLLNQVLNRLFEYYTSNTKYMSDHNNPIIRLADNDTMHNKYYIGKEEITLEMLR